MNNYSLRLIKVYKYGQYQEYEDVVTQFEWSIIFTDGVSESSSAGITRLPTPPEGITLKPIDELTDDDYFGWIMQDIGPEGWARIQQINQDQCAKLTKELEYQIHYDVSIEAVQLYNKILEI